VAPSSLVKKIAKRIPSLRMSEPADGLGFDPPDSFAGQNKYLPDISWNEP